MLQVRNLPDAVHAKLKERAAEARMSLSDYVAQELAKLVEYRTNSEIAADARSRIQGRWSKDDTVAIIRELRGPLP